MGPTYLAKMMSSMVIYEVWGKKLVRKFAPKIIEKFWLKSGFINYAYDAFDYEKFEYEGFETK